MARWKQIFDPTTQTSTFVPLDGESRKQSKSAAVHGDIDAFISPIDHSVIDDRKKYREHCERHGVVPSEEFSADHYKRKADERARLFNGEPTKEERRKRRQEMYEIASYLERSNGRR